MAPAPRAAAGPAGAALDKRRPLRYLPLLLLFVAAAAILRPFQVRSNDMAPALQDGDLGLVIPLPQALFGPPRRGDLVLAPPGDVSDRYLRRVVGMPGEVLEIAAGKILLEGSPLEGPQTGQMIYPVGGVPRRFRRRDEQVGGGPRYEVVEQEAWHLPDRPGVKLGSGEYYLLADRRTGAMDSRDYGPIKGEQLRRVVAVSLIPAYSHLLKGWEAADPDAQRRAGQRRAR